MLLRRLVGRQAGRGCVQYVAGCCVTYTTVERRAVLDRQHRGTTCTNKNWSRRRRRVPWSAVSPYRMQTTHRLHAPSSHTPCPTSLGNNSLSHIPPAPIPPAPYPHACLRTVLHRRTDRHTTFLPPISTAPHRMLYHPAASHTQDIPEPILPPSLPRFLRVNDWRLVDMPSPTPAAAVDANPRLFPSVWTAG